MDEIRREQFPFAFALALTRVAQEGQTGARAQAHQSFDLHTEYLPRNILIEAARKKDIQRYGVAQAAVFTGDKATQYLGLHELGGTKVPSKGRATLSIPSVDFPEGGLTATGAIRTNLKPKKLLEYYNATKHAKGKKRGKKRKPRAFIIPAEGNRPAIIARRRGPMRYPLEYLYTFKASAEIEADFGMENAVRLDVNRTFLGHVEKALNEALESARKR
jgi:hypothetical protein